MKEDGLALKTFKSAPGLWVDLYAIDPISVLKRELGSNSKESIISRAAASHAYLRSRNTGTGNYAARGA